MKLNVITWNINFIHDNWLKRLNKINIILENHIDNTDIILLQEATLPFNNKLRELYSFLSKKNIKYFDSSLLERNNIYKYIYKNFPQYKKKLYFIFDYFMNKLMWLCGYIFSYWGENLKKLYFNYPYVYFFISLLCIPIFLGMWYFLGLLTIVKHKIKTNIKTKHIGNRIIQYFDFTYNSKPIRCVNIHLQPGNKKKEKEKRLDSIKQIIKLCKNNKNVILVGDFNDTQKSKMYKYMKKKGYNCVFDLLGKKINTFPCKMPNKCIDFIMIKGDISATNAFTFGNSDASDHKGIKVTLDI